jgi:hypothetical protein
MTEFLAASLAYAARGWPVFPVKARGKDPLTSRGFYDATTRGPAIEERCRRWPRANIGVPTGPASGFDVLDIDPKHGGDESLAAIEAQHGRLPHTVRAFTGSGGLHILFAHHPGVTNRRGTLPPGIDVRGEGGYIVVEPSIHPNGRPYAWDVDAHPDEVQLAPWPEWLLAIIRADAPKEARPVSEWRDLLAGTIGEGRRNETIASVTGHLLRRGVDAWVTLELVASWNACRCRPPLPDNEVERTVASIARKEADRLAQTEANRLRPFRHAG